MHTVIGLQARQAPAIAFVRDLLIDGTLRITADAALPEKALVDVSPRDPIVAGAAPKRDSRSTEG